MRSKPLKFFKFQKLPLEIQLSIFDVCSQPTLLALCQASRLLHYITLPALYRDVNLSTHNLGPIKYDREWNNEIWSDSWPQPDEPDHYKRHIASRQRIFLFTLFRHPEYGPWVHRLTWTLLFEQISPLWDNTADLAVETAMCHARTARTEFPDTVTWTVFSRLINIQYLDLASLHFRMANPYIRNPPFTLFSTATSIRLLGWMNHELANAILLTIDPALLVHLAMDNASHWGQRPDGTPYHWQDPTGDPATIPPGPLNGHLDPLRGLCTNLKSLYLRKSGHDTTEWHPHKSWQRDIDLYREWACFVASVKGTLEYLTFEQGWTWSNRLEAGMVGRDRPMDERFCTHFLPVLETPGWRRLKRLEVRGVSQDCGMDQRAVAAVREAVGEETRIVVNETTERPCGFWEGM